MLDKPQPTEHRVDAQIGLRDSLRKEAQTPPDPVHTGEATKETQIIAIYGKGGIGKSFTLSNLSYMMAQQGKKVLLIGCDPKSDTTSLLFSGRSCPTIIETSSSKKSSGEEVAIGDVCFKRDGVYAMELGGPEVGRGCGGRGIIHGFELMEKLGFHDWDFDYVLLDFLGDVVCGGFGLPIARDMCQKVIVVASNDLQSLYVANNVCSAVEYFRKLGGNVGVAGMVVNKDDGTGEAQNFADSPSVYRSCRPYRPTKIFAARARTTKSSASPAGAGRRFSKSSVRTSRKPRRCTRRRWTTTVCWRCSTVTRLAEAFSCSRQRRKKCAVASSSSGRRWRSCTTTCRHVMAVEETSAPPSTGCHAGGELRAAARESGQDRDPKALCGRLSGRAARPAAEYVSGVRFVARRAADAAHGNDPCRGRRAAYTG